MTVSFVWARALVVLGAVVLVVASTPLRSASQSPEIGRAHV